MAPAGTAKYISTKFYFVIQLVEQSKIQINFVKSDGKVADELAKALSPQNMTSSFLSC